MIDGRGLEVSLSGLAASAIRWMIHAGLTRRVARNTVPVGLRAISDGTSGADRVAGTVVHIETISTVEADEVLGTLLAASGASLTDRSEGGESGVAGSLADGSLEDQRRKAAGTVGG